MISSFLHVLIYIPFISLPNYLQYFLTLFAPACPSLTQSCVKLFHFLLFASLCFSFISYEQIVLVIVNNGLNDLFLCGLGGGKPMEITGTATEWTAEQTVESMVDARIIIIVPGYGLAVAKGQYPVAEIVDILRKKVRLSSYFHIYISLFYSLSRS